MESEKLFPIYINPNLCIRCQRCMHSCSNKAIFFNRSLRYVNYNKCQGCLKCVDICEYGAIEVISVREGELKGLSIDHEKCEFCKLCIEEDFCFQQLFSRKKNKITGLEQIEFKEGDFHKCFKCLKCFKECPYNAIIPIIV